jgi:putative aminopeptidase FrvX
MARFRIPRSLRFFERAAEQAGLPLQRSAQVNVLTDSSYGQLVHHGVAAIDLGFPCRYTHSALEVCDLADLVTSRRCSSPDYRALRPTSASIATTIRNERHSRY